MERRPPPIKRQRPRVYEGAALLILSTAPNMMRPALTMITPAPVAASVSALKSALFSIFLSSTPRMPQNTSHQEQSEKQNERKQKQKVVRAQAHTHTTTLVAIERSHARPGSCSCHHPGCQRKGERQEGEPQHDHTGDTTGQGGVSNILMYWPAI